ncbi:MAG: hypothetical protein KBG80_04100 [Breznakibacter sp.]|nr:hypothetical protein [Breznakibacter sp.]
MNRKNNLERIVEQLSNGVAIVISLQKSNKFEEAQEHFGFEIERFLHTPYDQFIVDMSEEWIEIFLHKYGSSLELIENFGSLLLVGAELAFETHRITEGFLLVTKCQRLFAMIIENKGDLSDDQERKVERLAVLISKFSN